MKRVILVHNPSAGNGRFASEELIERLEEAGFQVRHVDAKNKKQLRSLRKVRGGLIVVAGGDGTVGKVSRRIAGSGAKIAVLPLGTANNIAWSLGLGGEVPELIAGLKRARSVKVDVGFATGPWGERVFVEGVGAGLFADVMAALDSGRKPRRRKRMGNGENHVVRFSPDDKHLEGALQALAERLPDYKAFASHVSIDGKKISGRFLLIEAMNMPFFGPNLHLVPDANPSDGKFDIVLLGEDRRQEFQAYLQHRLEGGKDAPMVTAIKGKSLRFEWGGANLHIDDKSVSMHAADCDEDGSKVVKVTIERGALEFLVPAVTSARNANGRPAHPAQRTRFRSLGA